MSRHEAAARWCSVLVAGLFAVVVITGTAVAATEPVDLDPDTDLDGSGNASDPYNVTNASELQAMAGNLTADYQLTETINATNTSQWDGGNGFKPIGNDTNRFNGSLDGNGFEIQNLTINRTSDDVGLIGFAGTDDPATVAELTNVTLTSVDVTGANAVGALVGNSTNVLVTNVRLAGGTVNGSGDAVGGLLGVLSTDVAGEDRLVDAHVENATVKGVTDVGGMVGISPRLSAEMTIKNSSVNATVNGRKNVGGFIGRNYKHRIDNVTTAGSVTATSTGMANASGIVGLYDTSSEFILDSTSSVTVSAPGANVGGVGGSVRGRVSRTYATGNVSGGSRVGGLVGRYEPVGGGIFKSFATGDVEAAGASGDGFGGLVGESLGGPSGGNFIVKVYATGAVDGHNDTGGLIGSTNTDNDISEAYAAGPVSGATNTGGLVGNASQTTVIGAYWDEARTGQASSALGDELRTYEMVGDEAEIGMPSIANSADWEIVNETNAANVSYPILTDLEREPQLLYPEFDRPTLVSGEVTNAAPDEVRLEFDSTITLNETPKTEGFRVFISGTPTTINTATVNGQTLILSLAESVSAGDSVTFTNTDDNKENLLDTDGDEAPSFTTGADGVPNIENNVGGGGGGGGGAGGGGGDGDEGSDDDSVDQTVDNDGDTDVTGGSSGDVIEIDDRTLRRGGSFDGIDNIAVDGLSIELANDRDFWIDVETYELGEEDAVDAAAEADGGGDDGENSDTDDVGDESAESTTTSITASFEAETETVSVGYVTVTHNLEPEDIADVTFNFSVRDEYLDELDVDPENVSLYRQTDEWTSLSTDYQELRFSRYRFEADSPGFSSFAIGTNAPLSIVINGTLGQSAIKEGETATALATVNNRGQNAVTHTVNLTADGQAVATETVTVDGGEIVEVPLSFAPPAGEYAMAVDEVSLGSLTVTTEESQPPWWLLVVAIVVLLVVVWYRQRDEEDDRDGEDGKREREEDE